MIGLTHAHWSIIVYIREDFASTRNAGRPRVVLSTEAATCGLTCRARLQTESAAGRRGSARVAVAAERLRERRWPSTLATPILPPL